jgi:alpha-tubulin suppressor-like RCC1 family protein
MGLGNTFTNVIAISAGGNHSLMLKSDGTVWGCGFDSTGLLGQGGTTNTNKYYPVQMLGVTGAIAIAAGGHHSVILKNDGTVWTCGDNYFGELGNGSNINNNTATPISGLNGIIAIAAGNYHSIALKNDGTVYTWGSNSGGQLGLGNDIDSNVPVQISGLSGATSIEAGMGHSFIQKNDGTFWGSGFNYQGQLGIGNYTNSSIFQQINNLCNTLSTPKNNLAKLISIYPNPVKDFITIQNPENYPIDTISISDLTGKKVYEQKGSSTTINVKHLQNGLYLLQTNSEGKNSVTKFIKQ